MLHCPRTIARRIVCSGLFFASGLATALAADPTGDWRVADGVANIRVAQCNGSMWGVVAWEKTPGGKDSHNPDASKQGRPTLGMPILLDMKKKAGIDQWEGQVYNAQDGQTYSSTIKPIGSDQLEIQGCMLGFLCGGETWTRVAPPIPSSPVNSMAKGAPKAATALPRTATPAVAAPAPPAQAVPKTTGAANPAPKPPGQRQAAGQAATDSVGDICLLPDIARFAH
ncbi:DUF2147 domain-containing protein [Bradyrhizobium sp.]|uniref:DUF2147 domain-containing protein n=1 Tax=Bradyrhizobium sp. TaxID=376 RepID=UPI003C77E05A